MMTADIVAQISNKWWTFLVRGVVAIALAAFAFSSPTMLATGLVYVVTAYFIISGVAALFAGVSLTGVGYSWTLVLLGVVEAALGVIMLTQPGAGPLALAYLFALWMITSGVLEISAANSLRDYINNEFWWVLLGIITVAFGVYIVLRPDIGILGLVYTVGIYAALAGITLIVLSFRVKSFGSAPAGRKVAT